MRADLGTTFSAAFWCLVCLGATAVTAAAASPPLQVDPDDARLSVQVRTALVNDPQLGAEPIVIDVRDGAVTLTGRVATTALAERAVEIVRQVDGVREVTSAITVGPAETVGRDRPGRLPSLARPPRRGPLGIVGIGLGANYGTTPDRALGNGVGVGPVIRFRPRRGWGPALGFSWTRTPLRASPSGQSPLADLVVRPVMAGVEYGLTQGRVSTAVSLVGGYAFNTLRVDTDRAGPNRAIAVADSGALRAGVSVWVDVTSRIGLNLFGGYRLTRPTVTFADDTSLEKRRLNADAVLLGVGFAYWIF